MVVFYFILLFLAAILGIVAGSRLDKKYRWCLFGPLAAISFAVWGSNSAMTALMFDSVVVDKTCTDVDIVVDDANKKIMLDGCEHEWSYPLALSNTSSGWVVVLSGNEVQDLKMFLNESNAFHIVVKANDFGTQETSIFYIAKPNADILNIPDQSSM